MAKKLTNAQKLKIQNLLFDGGLEIREIAADMSLSEADVEKHVEDLKTQLNKVADAQEKVAIKSDKVLQLMGRKTKDGKDRGIVVATPAASELQDERKKNRKGQPLDSFSKDIFRPKG